MSRRRSRVVHLLIALLLALSFAPASLAVTSAATTGSLYIYKKNGDGARLLNSCFQLYKHAGNGQRGDFVIGLCDGSNAQPVDGKLVFSKLPPGSYVLVESFAPAGYAFAVDRVVTIVVGERTQEVVRDPRGGTTLVVTTTNPGGSRLSGACYSVAVDAGNGNIGNYVTNFCDGNDGTNDGVTNIRGLRIGNYVLSQYVSPTGHRRADNKTFRVPSSSGTLRQTVVNQPVIASQAVTINKVDPNGVPVAGACFQLSYQQSNPDAPGGIDVGNYAGYFACDSDDGAFDGKIVLNGVAAGTYVAMETLTPAGYQVAPIMPFTKVSGTAKTLRIVDKFGGTLLKFLLRDDEGNVLTNGCISVNREVSGRNGVFIAAHCDQADGSIDGTITFNGMPNGRFIASEYVAPSGGWFKAPFTFTMASNSTKTITVKHTSTSKDAIDAADEATPSATAEPSATPEPTVAPTETPTAEPTEEPTSEPTVEPTDVPTEEPTEVPTEEPSPEPTEPTEPADGTPVAA